MFHHESYPPWLAGDHDQFTVEVHCQSGHLYAWSICVTTGNWPILTVTMPASAAMTRRDCKDLISFRFTSVHVFTAWLG